MIRFIPLSLILPFAFAAASFAAAPAPVATWKLVPGKGDSARAVVSVSIPKGWHIQSNAPLDDFLIPTEVKLKSEAWAFGKPVFPKAKIEDFPDLGGKVAVFEGTIEVRVPAVRKAGAKAAPEAAAVSVRYQACDKSQCLPPKEITAKYAP